jgi:hypothetical protein
MARPMIRHYSSGLYNYFKGEPPSSLRPGSYVWDENKEGYWVSHGHLKILRQKALEERRAIRLANSTRFGKGSGRAGGGRGAAHKAHHLEAVNNGTPSLDCPICYHRKLWSLWLTSDYGRWADKWEGWIERELLRKELSKMVLEKKKSLMRDIRALHILKLDLLKKSQKEIEELKERLREADIFFDSYMRKHRFEVKAVHATPLAKLSGFRERVEDFCAFIHLGVSFVYDRTSTHEGRFSTEFCIDPRVAVTHEREFSPVFHIVPEEASTNGMKLLAQFCTPVK